MTGSNSRKRITVIASVQGLEQANLALPGQGFSSQAKFAEVQLVSRTVVTKFFNRHPIQLDTFQQICKGLDLDWKEILDSNYSVEIGKLKEAEQPEGAEMSATATDQSGGTTLAIARRITVQDSQRAVKAEIVLEGDIDSVNDNDTFKAILEVLLKEYGGNTIQITEIKKGSIKITIQGSQDDIEQLRRKITSRQLTQIDEYLIQDFKILGDESLEALENPSLQSKWELIQEIKTHSQLYRQLRDADLSDANLIRANLSEADLIRANLSEADLSGAFLIRANLIRADLRRANLSGAFLIRANLIRADLRRADLSGADLSDAFLSDAFLSDAVVQDARFGTGQGLSKEEKRDLTRRGAIFGDAAGDRESSSVPAGR